MSPASSTPTISASSRAGISSSLALDKKLAKADSDPWCGVQVIDLDTAACVHWFRIDGAIGELYDVAVVPGVTRAMSLSFASNEVLGLFTRDPLEERASF